MATFRTFHIVDVKNLVVAFDSGARETAIFSMHLNMPPIRIVMSSPGICQCEWRDVDLLGLVFLRVGCGAVGHADMPLY